MTKKKKKLIDMQRKLENYVTTYKEQKYWLEYDETIFLDDMLYGIGIALDVDKYKMADGYENFLLFLMEHIKSKPFWGGVKNSAN